MIYWDIDIDLLSAMCIILLIPKGLLMGKQMIGCCKKWIVNQGLFVFCIFKSFFISVSNSRLWRYLTLSFKEHNKMLDFYLYFGSNLYQHKTLQTQNTFKMIIMYYLHKSVLIEKFPFDIYSFKYVMLIKHIYNF